MTRRAQYARAVAGLGEERDEYERSWVQLPAGPRVFLGPVPSGREARCNRAELGSTPSWTSSGSGREQEHCTGHDAQQSDAAEADEDQREHIQQAVQLAALPLRARNAS